jgi:hypothetical protein
MSKETNPYYTAILVEGPDHRKYLRTHWSDIVQYPLVTLDAPPHHRQLFQAHFFDRVGARQPAHCAVEEVV